MTFYFTLDLQVFLQILSINRFSLFLQIVSSMALLVLTYSAFSLLYKVKNFTLAS